jgi:hypothetical protein
MRMAAEHIRVAEESSFDPGLFPASGTSMSFLFLRPHQSAQNQRPNGRFGNNLTKECHKREIDLTNSPPNRGTRGHIRGPMMKDKSEYVAALCRVRNGEIAPFESSRFHAISTTEAVRRANEWAVSVVEFLAEPTWLQVKIDGRGVHSLRVI